MSHSRELCSTWLLAEGRQANPRARTTAIRSDRETPTDVHSSLDLSAPLGEGRKEADARGEMLGTGFGKSHGSGKKLRKKQQGTEEEGQGEGEAGSCSPLALSQMEVSPTSYIIQWLSGHPYPSPTTADDPPSFHDLYHRTGARVPSPAALGGEGEREGEQGGVARNGLNTYAQTIRYSGGGSAGSAEGPDEPAIHQSGVPVALENKSAEDICKWLTDSGFQTYGQRVIGNQCKVTEQQAEENWDVKDRCSSCRSDKLTTTSGTAKSLERMTTEEVCKWLTDSGFGTYVPHIREFGITGQQLANTDSELFDQLQLRTAEDRERLLFALYQELNPSDMNVEEILGITDINNVFSSVELPVQRPSSEPWVSEDLATGGHLLQSNSSYIILEDSMVNNSPGDNSYTHQPVQEMSKRSPPSTPSTVKDQESLLPQRVMELSQVVEDGLREASRQAQECNLPKPLDPALVQDRMRCIQGMMQEVEDKVLQAELRKQSCRRLDRNPDKMSAEGTVLELQLIQHKLALIQLKQQFSQVKTQLHLNNLQAKLQQGRKPLSPLVPDAAQLLCMELDVDPDKLGCILDIDSSGTPVVKSPVLPLLAEGDLVIEINGGCTRGCSVECLERMFGGVSRAKVLLLRTGERQCARPPDSPCSLEVALKELSSLQSEFIATSVELSSLRNEKEMMLAEMEKLQERESLLLLENKRVLQSSDSLKQLLERSEYRWMFLKDQLEAMKGAFHLETKKLDTVEARLKDEIDALKLKSSQDDRKIKDLATALKEKNARSEQLPTAVAAEEEDEAVPRSPWLDRRACGDRQPQAQAWQWQEGGERDQEDGPQKCHGAPQTQCGERDQQDGRQQQHAAPQSECGDRDQQDGRRKHHVALQSHSRQWFQQDGRRQDCHSPPQLQCGERIQQDGRQQRHDVLQPQCVERDQQDGRQHHAAPQPQCGARDQKDGRQHRHGAPQPQYGERVQQDVRQQHHAASQPQCEERDQVDGCQHRHDAPQPQCEEKDQQDGRQRQAARQPQCGERDQQDGLQKTQVDRPRQCREKGQQDGRQNRHDAPQPQCGEWDQQHGHHRRAAPQSQSRESDQLDGRQHRHAISQPQRGERDQQDGRQQHHPAPQCGERDQQDGRQQHHPAPQCGERDQKDGRQQRYTVPQCGERDQQNGSQQHHTTPQPQCGERDKQDGCQRHAAPQPQCGERDQKDGRQHRYTAPQCGEADQQDGRQQHHAAPQCGERDQQDGRQQRHAAPQCGERDQQNGRQQRQAAPQCGERDQQDGRQQHQAAPQCGERDQQDGRQQHQAAPQCGERDQQDGRQQRHAAPQCGERDQQNGRQQRQAAPQCGEKDQQDGHQQRHAAPQCGERDQQDGRQQHQAAPQCGERDQQDGRQQRHAAPQCGERDQQDGRQQRPAAPQCGEKDQQDALQKPHDACQPQCEERDQQDGRQQRHSGYRVTRAEREQRRQHGADHPLPSAGEYGAAPRPRGVDASPGGSPHAQPCRRRHHRHPAHAEYGLIKEHLVQLSMKLGQQQPNRPKSSVLPHDRAHRKKQTSHHVSTKRHPLPEIEPVPDPLHTKIQRDRRANNTPTSPELSKDTAAKKKQLVQLLQMVATHSPHLLKANMLES
ncbi:uncharacterized protein LOC129700591 [Leucoraja erinacea]|uniref:uncharacterized protein LOC129700591 n=1 Tax=Leucoraja erinaceus TaxID=7782 RepID=UPI002458E4DF|nr:uncharacterized protein LOC129700591 [Leucoraja erinacea]